MKHFTKRESNVTAVVKMNWNIRFIGINIFLSSRAFRDWKIIRNEIMALKSFRILELFKS